MTDTMRLVLVIRHWVVARRALTYQSEGNLPAYQIKGLSVTIFLQKRGHWVTDPKMGGHWV